MQLITGAQVRMARSLLKWTREKLAAEVNVSRKTIRIFEDDVVIRESIILDIHSVFDAHGVEFTPDGGVKARDTSIKDFRGVGSCDRFFDYLEKTVKAKGGDVVCMVDSQNLLTKSTGKNKQTNLERMEQLHKVVPVKCLLMDANIILPTRQSFEVRVLPDIPNSMVCSLWAYDREYTHAIEFDPRFHFQHPVYMVIESPYHTNKAFEYFHLRWNFAKPYVYGSKAQRVA